MKTFKGFDKNLQCRGYQFEIGETYEHKGDVKACRSGFHSCEFPFDVFTYYPPASSRFAETLSFGTIDTGQNDDTKISSANITIKTELSLSELIQRGIDLLQQEAGYTGDQSVSSSTGSRSVATNTNDRSVATNTNDRSITSSTGFGSVSSSNGFRSAATNTGDQSVSSSNGFRSAATNTGYQSVSLSTGDRSVSLSTGNRSVSSNSGDKSVAISNGFLSSSEILETDDNSQHSLALATGINSRARAPKGSAIVCVYRKPNGELINIRASKVGENGIKPNVWYTLNEEGEFVQVAD